MVVGAELAVPEEGERAEIIFVISVKERPLAPLVVNADTSDVVKFFTSDVVKFFTSEVVKTAGVVVTVAAGVVAAGVLFF